MVVEHTKYAIATKSFPLFFDDGEGNSVDTIEDAAIGSKEDCEAELKCFDEPENYQIIEVKVSYEF